jgi:hypothetical protein
MVRNETAGALPREAGEAIGRRGSAKALWGLGCPPFG